MKQSLCPGNFLQLEPFFKYLKKFKITIDMERTNPLSKY